MKINTIKYMLLFVAALFTLWILNQNAVHVGLTNKLALELPILVEQSLKNAADEQQELVRISEILSAQNSVIKSRASFAFNAIEFVVIKSLRLTKHNKMDEATFSWLYGNHTIYASLRLEVGYNYFILVAQSAFIALVLFLLLLFLDKLSGANKVKWQRRLESSGFEQQQAEKFADTLLEDPMTTALYERLTKHTQLTSVQVKQACEHKYVKQLSALECQWFIVALAQGKSIEQSIQIALSKPELAFDLNQQSVMIHGLAIRLPKTPLFYFYWYAKRKINDLPAYLNPPVSKPDTENGQILANLMLKYGGHQKAIRDLSDEGLKGKTLDQNRNKIKTELQRVLGELSQDYLFDSERDTKTARYKYILKIPKEHIIIS